jgi:hypothetical protein
VRFSRGFGLPEPLPEILSVAVKVRDAYGPGADQDFLMTASGDRPGLRHTFAWGRSHLAHGYSTVIPFSARAPRSSSAPSRAPRRSPASATSRSSAGAPRRTRWPSTCGWPR